MYKILIVDDENLIRNGLKKIIDWDEHGIEIVGEASNGEEALEAINNLKPDLLLTDIKMPVMDGLTLIKAVRGKSLNIKIIIISGYDEFQYLKEAFKYGIENYIIKPINEEELSSTLISAVEKIQSETYDRIKTRENEFVIRDSLLYRLVTNRLSKRELTEKFSLMGIDRKHSFIQVAVIKALIQGGHNSNPINDSSLLGLAMVNILNETIDEQFCNNIFIDLNGDVVVIFHSNPSAGLESKVETLLKQSMENIQSYLKTDLFIVVGNTQENIESVHLSYKAASDLMQFFVIFPRNYILSSDKFQWEDKNRNETYIVDQELLKNLILSCNKDEINNYFDKIYEKFIEAPVISMEHINAFTIELMACLINTIKEVFTETEDLLLSHEELFSSLLKQKMPVDLIYSAKSAALGIMDIVQQAKEKPMLLVDQIMDYINSNYFRQDMSLKTLSYKFNFSTPYLGQLLKKKTGELFSDYLNKVRVRYAKELLLNTSLKGSEISEKVGYSDPNYFSRIFKKIVGVYLSEYRNVKK